MIRYFIPIKSHSARVDAKNFQIVNGKRLWMHLVDELRGEFIGIDTDCNDLVKNNGLYGMPVVYKRSQEHIDQENHVGCPSPILGMIERFINEHCVDDDIVVNTHVTSPFLKKDTTKSAIIAMLSGGYDSCSSVREVRDFVTYNGSPVNYDASIVQRTQTLTPVLVQNGAFYCFKASAFKRCQHRITDNHLWYPIKFPESLEIDTYSDLEAARVVARGLA